MPELVQPRIHRLRSGAVSSPSRPIRSRSVAGPSRKKAISSRCGHRFHWISADFHRIQDGTHWIRSRFQRVRGAIHPVQPGTRQLRAGTHRIP